MDSRIDVPPRTLFERYFTDFLDCCSKVISSAISSPARDKAKEELRNYKTAYSSTHKQGKLHTYNIIAFKELMAQLPQTSEEIESLDWLNKPIVLRFIRQDGSPAQKTYISLTDMYNLIDENDSMIITYFSYTLLRCIECSTPDIEKQVIVGYAADVLQREYEELISENEAEDNSGSFIRGISELKKLVTNPEILRSGVKEVKGLYETFQNNPAAKQTADMMFDDNIAAEEKIAKLANLAENQANEVEKQ